MTPEERIKLAEAIGREHCPNAGCGNSGAYPTMPDGGLDQCEWCNCYPTSIYSFQPCTNPNDDYAVLEWMRESYQRKAWSGTATERRCWTLFHQNLPDIRDYKIGDYARAALKVLNNES